MYALAHLAQDAPVGGVVKDLLLNFWRLFIDSLPVLMIITALIAYLVSFLPHFDDGAKTHIRAISLAILASGFFSWLTKSTVFRGVLRDELTKSYFEPAALSARKDVTELWKNVSVAAGLPKEFAELGWQGLLQRMIDGQRQFYYSVLTREHVFAWVDQAKGVVSIRTRVHGTLLSVAPDRPIDFVTGVVGRKGEKLNSPPKLIGFTIIPLNPVTTCAAIKAEAFAQESGARYVVSRQLPPSREYKVDMEWEYQQDVDEDSLVIFESKSFIKHLTLKATFRKKEMTVVFRELGNIEMKDDPDGSATICRQSGEKGLLTPYNGYILAIHRRPAEE